MMTKILINVFASSLALLGYILIYILNKKKLRGFKCLLVFSAGVIAVALIQMQYYSQNKEAASVQSRLTKITDQNKLLISNNDSLKTNLSVMQQDIRQMRENNQGLASLLEPFTKTARMSYPGLNDQLALQKLAADFSKMQPKLVFLGRSEPRRDSLTNLFHTAYVFRSQPSGGLRDISIKIRFDGVFAQAVPKIHGAIVEEYGTQMINDSDFYGFSYTTSYLREGNDVVIDVISRNPLEVTSMYLSPQ
jgi:hypothetical protein